MMGIVMPETWWAVSVRQSDKTLRLIVASSWVFYLSTYKFLLLLYNYYLFVKKGKVISLQA
jgi:hypothetical protein